MDSPLAEGRRKRQCGGPPSCMSLCRAWWRRGRDPSRLRVAIVLTWEVHNFTTILLRAALGICLISLKKDPLLLLAAIFLTRKAHNFTTILGSSQFLPPFFRGQHCAFVWLARLRKSSWPVFFVSAVRSTFTYPVYIFKILKSNIKVLQRQLFCICVCFAVRVIPEIQNCVDLA